MVHFDDETDTALFGAGVLTTDENAKAVFTGLTAAETQFVLNYDTSAPPVDTTESSHFHELLAKFHTARDIVLGEAERYVNSQLERYRHSHLNS
jgi:hypothetical protein